MGGILATTGARAASSSDDPNWIVQSGNGRGASRPVIAGFNMSTVIFDGLRFAAPNKAPRPGYGKFLAWGTVRNADGSIQLAMASGGDDGLAWTTSPATITDPIGNDLPFLVGNGASLDVVFNSGGSFAPAQAPQVQFAMWYRLGNADSHTFSSFRQALSADGVHWTDNCENTTAACPLTQSNPDRPVVTATGPAFKRGSFGPTDVIFNPTGSTSAACVAQSGPWSCQFVMLLDNTDDSLHYVGIAGSGDGKDWAGMPAPLLRPSPSGWDSTSVTAAHARYDGNRYILYYSGGSGPANACGSRPGPCLSIGTSTSQDGMSFPNAAQLATPPSLFDAVAPGAPSSLANAQTVELHGLAHALIYLTRQTSDGGADTFIASTTSTPTESPVVTIVSPSSLQTTSATSIDIYASDAFGAHVGVAASSVSVAVDGLALGDVSSQTSLIGAYRVPSIALRRPANNLVLADGRHVLTFSVRDLDDNITTVTREFLVDTSAPATTLSTSPSEPRMGYPNSVGSFAGVTDGSVPSSGAPLARLVANVTDPLGQKTTYSNTLHSWNIHRVTDQKWQWTWIAPASDSAFVIPGTYTFSFLGWDAAGNVEKPNAHNTASILIV
jgi:hypothetical protein